MIKVIAFDAYGTLFDFNPACSKALGPDGAALSLLWRQKQTAYSWLRSLMNNYANF